MMCENSSKNPRGEPSSEVTVFCDRNVYCTDIALIWKSPSILYELDLETMTYKNLTSLSPSGLPESFMFNGHCPQLINRKFYIILSRLGEERKKYEIWAYDLDLKIWNQIKTTDNGPVDRSRDNVISCNQELILYGGWYENTPMFGDFWSVFA